MDTLIENFHILSKFNTLSLLCEHQVYKSQIQIQIQIQTKINHI